jgi:hypothetical protein
MIKKSLCLLLLVSATFMLPLVTQHHSSYQGPVMKADGTDPPPPCCTPFPPRRS